MTRPDTWSGRRSTAPRWTPRRRLPATAVIACVATLVGGAPAAWAGLNVWTSHGPEGGYVHALAIDTATPTRLYTGTDGGGVFAIEQVDVCVGDCTIDGSVSVDDVIT